MKKKLFVIFFLITSITIAQNNIEVKYAAFFSKSELEGNLVFNQKEMYFQLMNPNYGSQNKFDLDPVNDDKVVITENDLKTSLMGEFYKKATNDYYTLNFPSVSNEVTKVFDELPNVEWEIIPDSKKEILGFNCQRAEATYRGSKIVAYFTTEIPTIFGPAKFGGLPGLILEVNDVTPGYSNSYSAYEINFDSNQPLKIIEKTKSFIDYKSYVKINDSIAEEKTNQFLQKMRANSPRGYKTEKKGKQKRSGFEKVYEWETR